MGYKHTPGPWSVKKHFSEWLIGDGNYLIATTAGSPAHLGRASAERDAANARLIAAAPDLLKALEDCVAVMDRELAGLKVIQPEFSAARAAIAKATGEQQ